MTKREYIREGLDFATGWAVEEIGELGSALGKTIRWGWLSTNPELPEEKQETNLEWVRREIDDVRRALGNLEGELDRKYPRPTRLPPEDEDDGCIYAS